MKLIFKNNKLKLAFTLVEIMIVVMILGLLASIIIPGLNRARSEMEKKLINTETNTEQEIIFEENESTLKSSYYHPSINKKQLIKINKNMVLVQIGENQFLKIHSNADINTEIITK